MTDINNTVRTRFAPAPTGVMHIGNVRAALLNYLFARQKGGTFILRIEDTDAQRMFDQDAREILYDLAWLSLDYNEGPGVGGNFGPYFQSLRTGIYAESLEYLIHHNFVYRCFCSNEELDKKRQRQIALKQPPRYDKTCLKLTTEQIEKNLSDNKEFIWRFNVPANEEVIVNDLAKGALHFNTNNLTDFPLTRTDGSFTFLFANAVDDIKMEMTHVFRGEDHLTNSASQLLMYRAFKRQEPIFLHLPIICNIEGKKLSKRDFGFSIKDLQHDGYLPEAVCNYLGILGGSYKEEILSLQDLIKEYHFDNLSSTSQIKYDPDKLKWINHKWIQKISLQDLTQRALPFIAKKYPNVHALCTTIVEQLIELIKTDIHCLSEAPEQLSWYFEDIAPEALTSIEGLDQHKHQLIQIFTDADSQATNSEELIRYIKTNSAAQGIPTKIVMQAIRACLTGQLKGPNIAEIVHLLGEEKTRARLMSLMKA